MGHVISEQGVEPDPSMVKAITDMPGPVEKQGVMRFCGMVNYLNTFCPNLSHVIKPLFDLMNPSGLTLIRPLSLLQGSSSQVLHA